MTQGQFEEALSALVSEPVVVKFVLDMNEDIITAEDLCDVLCPMLMDLGGVAESVEDARELCTGLFKLREPPIVIEEQKIDGPIIMAELVRDTIEDPFDRARTALARLRIQEVGTLPEVDDNIQSRRYVRALRKEEAVIERVREERLEAVDRENAQFRDGLGFRRPAVRLSRQLALKNINVTAGPLTLIENSALTLAPGNRYGLVGRNGLGKSTLMRYINSAFLKGTDEYLVIHVSQEAPLSPMNVLDFVLGTDLERTEILEALELEEDAAVIQRLNERLDVIGGRDANARAGTILAALGFSPEQMSAPVSRLSGGWRMRVSLAAALFIRPDVLLLDEPTGHLDAPSLVWLECFLTSPSCADQIMLIVSHDRVFLDNVATHIVHLKDKHLTCYKGNYSSFASQFEARCANLESQALHARAEIAHMEDFVRRLGVRAASAAMAQSRLKQIAKIEKEVQAPIQRDPPVRFEFGMTTVAAQEEVVILENFTFAYEAAHPIFQRASFRLLQKTRAVVIGPNGCGKSTLLGLVLGRLAVQDGYVQRLTNLRIAHFSQHHVDQLDYRSTPLQHLLQLFREQYPINQIRGTLGRFGLGGEQSLQPIQSLSGGQKTRVVLAECSLRNPHVLLLDEPTNNLDMESIAALGDALRRWPGALVVVTHDQAFATAVADQIFVCEGGEIREFRGTFAQYRDRIKDEIRERFFRTVTTKGVA